MNIDYETQLNKIKEAQKQSAIADLENTRNQALSDLEAEKENNARNFNSQRSQANLQNQIQAKNFKEYLVNSGRSNSGIMPQYEMNRQNNLLRSLNDINSSQNLALADIGRRGTLANQTYNTGLQGANANIEANYLNNLLQQQQEAWNRDMQQKQYDESIRQFNENLAMQQKKLDEEIRQYNETLAWQKANASRGGSSGGSGGSKKKTSNLPNITTEYYQGPINEDAQFGTFSNGYQPDNVNGEKLSKTGVQIPVTSKNLQGQVTATVQNVWKTSDGTKYVWDGTRNKYVKY